MKSILILALLLFVACDNSTSEFCINEVYQDSEIIDKVCLECVIESHASEGSYFKKTEEKCYGKN